MKFFVETQKTERIDYFWGLRIEESKKNRFFGTNSNIKLT